MITAVEAHEYAKKAIADREKKEMENFLKEEKEAIDEVINTISLAVEKGEFHVEIFIRQIFDYREIEWEQTARRLNKLFSYLKFRGYTVEPRRNDNFVIRWLEPKN